MTEIRYRGAAAGGRGGGGRLTHIPGLAVPPGPRDLPVTRSDKRAFLYQCVCATLSPCPPSSLPLPPVVRQSVILAGVSPAAGRLPRCLVSCPCVCVCVMWWSLVVWWVVSAAAEPAPVTVLQMRLTYNEVHVLQVNDTVEYILELTQPEGEVPSTVWLQVDGGDSSHPVLVTARQRTGE
ncbi:unnamed protein product [Danaus chrysippus]|uniref:(African queen) hypothetical protein n=1 Tax=Danaus chrysippus TaxID=151541 RepID=A0A8J2R282_9NEOP|nr:unnamed protein product [Danaus chrysippus]